MEKPELTIVLELQPPLAATITRLAHEYHDTPQQTATRLLCAALVGRECLALLAEILDLLAGHESDEEHPL